MRLHTLLCVVVAVLVLVPATVHGGSYTSVVPVGGSMGFWDFYSGGRYYGWDATQGSVSYYYDAPPAYRNHHYAFLRFDLPALLPGETVTSARLYLDVLSYSNFGGGYGSAYLYSAGNMTGGSGDLLGAGTGVSRILPSGTGWMWVDVSTAIAVDYASNYVAAAFILKPDGSGVGGSGMSFTADGTASSAYLQINTLGGVPEPSTVLTAVGALLLFAGMRFRRTTKP